MLYEWTDGRVAAVGRGVVQERLDQGGAERGTYALDCDRYPCPESRGPSSVGRSGTDRRCAGAMNRAPTMRLARVIVDARVRSFGVEP